MHGRDRPEPGLGQIEDIDPDAPRAQTVEMGDRPAPPRTSATSPRRRLWPIWLVLAVLAAAGVLHVAGVDLRQPFSGSETRDLLNAAARAESENRWHGDDASALALYRRVQVADPDNDVARLGLRRVAEQLRKDADAALDAAQPEQAEALIQSLADLGVAGEHVAALRRRLDATRVAGREMGDLLARAEAALARRRIRGDNGALSAYKRMLALDPGNAVARRGVEQSLQVLAEEAGSEITQGNLPAAESMIQALAAEQSLHAALPGLRQSLAEAGAAAQATAQAAAQADETARAEAAAAQRARSELELATTLAAGDDALRERRLEEAVAAYQRVLSRQPTHAEALEGLDLAGRAALERARAALSDSNLDAARSALDLARQAKVDADTLARLEGQFGDIQERLTAVLARPELDAEQQRRLGNVMARAQAAEGRGELVEPAGESAYDLYRHALSIDPMHDQARQAVAALPRRAQTLVVHHVELGQLDQAERALEALQAMAPMSPALPELQRMLAGAWLERGSDALRAGTPDEARRALDRARTVMPAHPGVQRLAAQLSQPF